MPSPHSLIILSSLLSLASSVPLEARQTTANVAYLNRPCGATYKVRAADGLCCSKWGYAGVTDDHCYLSLGCQSSWGRCINDKKPPALLPVSTKCAKSNDVALTFDDGPSVLTAGLLDYLKSVNVKATFFLNGLNYKAHETGNPLPGIYALADVVKRAKAEGHQICSHTWSHTDLITVNQYNMTYEMTRLNYAFKNILGVVPTCMRPPYGDIHDSSRRVLQGLGYTAIVNWNLDPVDWSPKIHGSTAAAQIQDMTDEIKTQTEPKRLLRSSFITLHHDVHNTTADFRPDGSLAPQEIKPFAQTTVEFLLAQKWNLVRVDQCLGKAVDSMYRAPNGNDDECGDEGTCFT